MRPRVTPCHLREPHRPVDAACACRGSGAGAGRAGWLPPLPYRPLSLSSAGQGQRCPRPTRGTAPRVSGSRQSALVCAVDAVAASASLRRVCWALDLLPLMSLSHAANTAVAAAATNAAVTAPLWPPPPRALVPLSARLEFAAQGFTAGQGASPNDLESAGTRLNGRFSRCGLFCHDSLMRCRVLGHRSRKSKKSAVFRLLRPPCPSPRPAPGRIQARSSPARGNHRRRDRTQTWRVSKTSATLTSGMYTSDGHAGMIVLCGHGMGRATGPHSAGRCSPAP